MSAFSTEKETRLKEIEDFLKEVSPTNIHLKTTARWGTKINFESVWYAHGPQAARYYLLPEFWNGSLRPTYTTS